MKSAKLEIALRERLGRAKRAAFIHGIATALSRTESSIRTASLTETDYAFEVFGRTRQKVEHECSRQGRFCRTFDRSSLAHDFFNDLAEEFRDQEVLLLRAESRWCGAVISSISEILHHALDLTSVEQEDLLACSRDGATGVFASRHEGRGPSTEDRFQVIAWEDPNFRI